MFLIVSGRYYNVANACAEDKNYLTLCGLRFPLKAGTQLVEEEKNYMRRHSAAIQERKAVFEKEINENAPLLNDLADNIALRNDVIFFITKLCAPHFFSGAGEDSCNRKITLPQLLDNECLLRLILDSDCAVMNGRVYYLEKTAVPVFVSLEGTNYTLKQSGLTVDDVERKFHLLLEQKLRLKAADNSKRVKGFKEKTKVLDNEIESLIVALKISKYAHCYETGDIGYDTCLRRVYWLVAPHYNNTTGRNYGEGQSAATIPLVNGELGTDGKFAERENRNQPFSIVHYSHCLGFSLVGSTLEEKMQYLKTFASVVKENGAIHE